MKVILGHSNMDADCLGSVILARYLYPDAYAIRSSRMHPFARQLYLLYEDHLELPVLGDLPQEPFDEFIVVDTHSLSQIREYLEDPKRQPASFRCIDHHVHVVEPIQGLTHLRHYGANCSVLVEMLVEQGIRVSPEDATIALAGIFADTGNFTHDNVKPQDFSAAEYLVDCGASVRMVRKFTNRLPDDGLMNLFHETLGTIKLVQVHGMRLALASVVLPEQVPGLNLVAERLAHVEQADGLFCIFELQREKQHLIIARSNHPGLDVAFVLGLFGGGGHPQAASALLKKSEGVPVLDMLRKTLELRTSQTSTASSFMEKPRLVVKDDWTLMETALCLEAENQSGAPVLDKDGKLVGMVSLRDIQKGRKANAMKSPVRAYMSHKVLTLPSTASTHDIEAFFMQHEVNRVPVMDGQIMVGLLSRSECLRQINGALGT